MTVKTNEIKQVFLLKKMKSCTNYMHVYVELKDGSIHMVDYMDHKLVGDGTIVISPLNVRNIYVGEGGKTYHPDGIKVFKRMKGFNEKGWKEITEAYDRQYD